MCAEVTRVQPNSQHIINHTLPSSGPLHVASANVLSLQMLQKHIPNVYVSIKLYDEMDSEAVNIHPHILRLVGQKSIWLTGRP